MEIGYSIFDDHTYVAIKTNLNFAINRLIAAREYDREKKSSE